MSASFRTISHFLDNNREYGAFLLRILIGWRLIDGTQDNIFSWERMLEFRDFLHQFGFPFPLLAANVSVYAQFICGILYILGLFVRPAAIVMVVNFLVALVMVHLGTTFQQSFEALVMLVTSVFFLFNGAGRLALDKS